MKPSEYEEPPSRNSDTSTQKSISNAAGYELPAAFAVLRVASLVFFGIFLVSVVLRSFPIRILDPLWQVSFITGLIDMGGYAILGVVILAIAHLLAPRHAPLLRQFRRVASLSRFAALGYLLVVPLLVSALIRDYSRVVNQQTSQLQMVQKVENQGIASLKAARNRAEILRAVSGFNAQALPSLQTVDMPLETLRSRALNVLSNNVAAAKAQFTQVEKRGFPWILVNNLRLLILALLFAFALSTAATGWPSFPLLGALILGIEWLLRLGRRGN